jgi:DNA-binding XRE family transcriptional regulator
MNKKEFFKIRSSLGRTQKQVAQLLGTSLKAVQSFEQGWRRTPVHIERQMLFLLAHKNSPARTPMACWALKDCSDETKRHCPAWEFQMGHLCWFINGTICQGEAQESWERKMKRCRKCEVYRSVFPAL